MWCPRLNSFIIPINVNNVSWPPRTILRCQWGAWCLASLHTCPGSQNVLFFGCQHVSRINGDVWFKYNVGKAITNHPYFGSFMALILPPMLKLEMPFYSFTNYQCNIESNTTYLYIYTYENHLWSLVKLVALYPLVNKQSYWTWP